VRKGSEAERKDPEAEKDCYSYVDCGGVGGGGVGDEVGKLLKKKR